MKKKWITFFLSLGLLMHMAVPFQASNPQPYVETAISQDDPGFMVPVDQKTTVPEGYIGIYTAQDLDNVRKDLDANYILMNDIDLSEYENWVPIGSADGESHNSNDVYKGIFDGNGYRISNISISKTDPDDGSGSWDSYMYSAGLFVEIYGTVKNLILTNIDYEMINYNSSCDVGGIVARCYGSIENCSVDGVIKVEKTYGRAFNLVGGIASELLNGIFVSNGSIRNTNGSIKNCLNKVKIIYTNTYGENYTDSVGGIVGYIQPHSYSPTGYYHINVTACKNAGEISVQGSNVCVGGIIGARILTCDNFETTFSRNVNTGNINIIVSDTSKPSVGGIIGEVCVGNENDSIILDQNINTGKISITNEKDENDGSFSLNCGGICGSITAHNETKNNTVKINNSYNCGTITSQGLKSIYIGGIVGSITTWAADNLFLLEENYNIGAITCDASFTYDTGRAGGIVGESSLKKLNSESDKTSECYITNCYYNNTGLPSCASTTPPTVDSSKALTDSEMQSASSFVGFDFNTVWEIGVTDGYPYPTLQNNPHIGNGSTVSKIPDDAVYFNGSYYKLYTITSSNKGSAAWNEALKHCEELGGHLAVINSQEENDFLYSYITSLGISTAYFGYTDEETENTWVWVTGEENTYTNWHTGEPNRENTNEDYASFYWKFTDGTWNDGNMGAGTNSDDRSYLCEWNATPTPPSVSGITIQCGDPVDYAGNTRIFTVIFAEKPTSAYLQFDNQYDPSKWLDDAYCASNVLFRIKPDEIVEKDGQYVYKTEFRIHSEGLESQNYMRKVRVCAEYSGTTTLSEAVSFQVNPLPVRETGNTIGYLYEQTIYDGTADTPAILNVTNTAGTGEDRILSVVNYSCDDAATPFFWWEADCGTFYEIAGDFTTVGFIPSSSGTVTVYMGDGLGYVTSYELTIEN